MMASLSQLEQSEASEDDPCPICLGEVTNAACLALCFHHFCFGCIQQWTMMGAACPLCRLPCHRILKALPSDDKEEEDRACFSTCHQRNVARERSQSRSPQQH